MVTEIIRTATQVEVIDESFGGWEHFSGEDIDLLAEYRGYESYGAGDYRYWEYRGQAAYCKRSTDDAIVRVRIGTPGDPTDRNIYRQIITDPTIASQWTTWGAALYTGPFYAVGIQRDSSAGAGYRIYHSNTLNFYRDNSILWTFPLFPIVKINPVPNKPGAVLVERIESSSRDYDGQQAIQWRYYPDITAGWGSSVDDSFDWEYLAAEAYGIVKGNDLYRFRGIPHGQNPRDPNNSDSLVLEASPIADPSGRSATHHYITQASKRAGITRIRNIFYLDELTGGEKWLLYSKRTFDENFDSLHNITSPIFFSRFKDPRVAITEPIPTGFSMWGFCGAAVVGNYLYIMGNGAVYRRAFAASAVQISNYFLEGSLEINEPNEKSTAQLTFANPNNVVANAIGYIPTSNTDNTLSTAIGRKVRVRLGQKLPTENEFVYNEPSLWWISKVNRIFKDNVQRVVLTLEDFWGRLEVPYTTDFYYPGRVDSRDMIIDGDNVVTNYFVADSKVVLTTAAGPSDSYPVKMKAVKNKYTLDTRWRLLDGIASIHFLSEASASSFITFRYIDNFNYEYVKYNASNGAITHGRKVRGKDAEVVSTAYTTSGLTNFYMAVVFLGAIVDVHINGVLRAAAMSPGFYDEGPPATPGFIGIKTAGNSGSVYSYNWKINNFQQLLTTGSLIQKALGHAGFLNSSVDFGLDDTEQVEIAMGPQTDITDPAKALEKLQEGTYLQAIWSDDIS